MNRLRLVSEFQPKGDQPQAIEALAEGVLEEAQHQVLLGVTGSGKTFTMANVIERVQKPTLVLSHNKTLAAQLYGEFKELFPDNAVEYFVSYYDYYQPEAYIPSTDTYIEKDTLINDEIDKMRHSATRSLLEEDEHFAVFAGRAQAVYAGYACHYYNVVARHQRARRRKAQAVDILVYRGIFLYVYVIMGDVRFGLVIIVIADKILDGVIREELFELR